MAIARRVPPRARMPDLMRSRFAASDEGVSGVTSKYTTCPWAEAERTRNLTPLPDRASEVGVPVQASIESAAIWGSAGAESGEKRERSSSAAAKNGFQSTGFSGSPLTG